MQKQTTITLPSSLRRVKISLGLADFIMREIDGEKATIHSSVSSPRHVMVPDLDGDTLQITPEDPTYGVMDLGTHGKIEVGFPRQVEVAELELSTAKVKSHLELPNHSLSALNLSGAGGEIKIELGGAKRIEISGTNKKGSIQLKDVSPGSRVKVSGVGCEILISIPKGTSICTSSSGMGNTVPKRNHDGEAHLRVEVGGIKNRVSIEEF